MRILPEPGGLTRLITNVIFSRKQWKFWLLFIAVLGAYAFNIRLAVLYNEWNGRFFDALQAVDREGIFRELFYFIGLAAVIIVLLVWAGYIKDRLILALRRDLTLIFFRRWLSPNSAHYLLRESGNEPDNPDQRVAEDVKHLVTLSVNLFVSFYDAMLTIGSFSVILWNLSGSAIIFGLSIPGYMFWVCVIYTVIATLLTHLIGRRLKTLNISAQRMEANLRAAMMEKRRHSDAIAGAHGEQLEEATLGERFQALLEVLIAFIKKRRDLDLFTVGVGQFTHLAPIFFSLPAFFAGAIQLGGVMQIRGAFNDVARSLSWIIMSYDDLAALAAAFERLKKLEAGLTDADREHLEISQARELTTVTDASSYALEADITLRIPSGEEGTISLVRAELALRPGTLTLITGSSGIGKSTLLKTLAGFSSRYSGRIRLSGSIVWMPQRPYLPKGTLKSALFYPLKASARSDDEAAALLKSANLGQLIHRLHEEADWASLLSGGEQQRISLLRALSIKPAVLLIDEMTSGLDEVHARRMLKLLREQLPECAIALVTHQTGLSSLADQTIELKGTPS